MPISQACISLCPWGAAVLAGETGEKVSGGNAEWTPRAGIGGPCPPQSCQKRPAKGSAIPRREAEPQDTWVTHPSPLARVKMGSMTKPLYGEEGAGTGVQRPRLWSRLSVSVKRLHSVGSQHYDILEEVRNCGEMKQINSCQGLAGREKGEGGAQRDFRAVKTAVTPYQGRMSVHRCPSPRSIQPREWTLT